MPLRGAPPNYIVGIKPFRVTWNKWFEGDRAGGVGPLRNFAPAAFVDQLSRAQFNKMCIIMKYAEKKAFDLGHDPNSAEFRHEEVYDKVSEAVFIDTHGEKAKKARVGELQISTLINKLELAKNGNQVRGSNQPLPSSRIH